MFGHKQRWYLPVIPVFIGSIFLAGCHHRPHTPEEKAEWMTEKIADELDLNKEQQGKLKQIVLTVQNQIPEMKETRKNLWNELYGQVKSDNINAQKLTATLNNQKDTWSASIPAITQGFSDFYAILTPEQKKELVRKMDKWNKRMME